MLYFPDIPSCDTCEKFLVDTEDWTLTVYQRTGEPLPRQKNDPPPCYCCPKCRGRETKNPEEGRGAELSEKNRLTLGLYWQSLVCSGGLTEADEVTRRNLGIIHEIFERHKRWQNERMIRQLAIR